MRIKVISIVIRYFLIEKVKVTGKPDRAPTT